MITVAPDPVLFWIGSFSIRFYGLVYSLGFLFTYWYLVQLSKHKRIKLTVDQIETFLIYSILGTIIGGRVGEFLFYQYDVLLSDPLRIFKIWLGGMSFHGAIIGIVISTTLFCRKYKVSFYSLSDHLVMPGALALVFGRLANFMNAELLGRITTIAKTPWCINWFGERSIDGQLICRHPSQIYESLKNLFMFSVMFFMQYDIRGRYKKKRYQPGYLTWLFILIYGAGRAFVDIWREDPTWFLGTLSTGQVLSTLMAIIALIVLYVKYWRKR